MDNSSSSSEGEKWTDVFGRMAQEGEFDHLHQMAGWKDLDDPTVWHLYVKDTIGSTNIRSGDRVFECGCGVGAFLSCVQSIVHGLQLSGVDASQSCIERARVNIADGHFMVGLLPEATKEMQEGSYDAVVCNSVFQYLPSLDVAETVVNEMLRLSARSVIIADVCDTEYEALTTRRMKEVWGDKYGHSLPAYLHIGEEWWGRFAAKCEAITFHRVNVEAYARRKERYVVTMTKKMIKDT
ncbi:unnamed protein product [Vitrella brassicaformis CCMP3155]|uniref:Methyltransferase type 12 domain-containing protein n=1 Tax=Vitrella brassicaformis (strain CCMP3155) TaxID=1169540 RepID=A0A0G4G5X1_VITBC|nr:unnamed protein product [Vitrella brassicaformis CCMP3155]|eukprot:CEM23797.1 unnamed protein product [Vitrella brassicaformis CCMP3155]